MDEMVRFAMLKQREPFDERTHKEPQSTRPPPPPLLLLLVLRLVLRAAPLLLACVFLLIWLERAAAAALSLAARPPACLHSPSPNASGLPFARTTSADAGRLRGSVSGANAAAAAASAQNASS